MFAPLTFKLVETLLHKVWFGLPVNVGAVVTVTTSDDELVQPFVEPVTV